LWRVRDRAAPRVFIAAVWSGIVDSNYDQLLHSLFGNQLCHGFVHTPLSGKRLVCTTVKKHLPVKEIEHGIAEDSVSK
jgi:hypothetical protein